jgi:hypothetical protein
MHDAAGSDLFPPGRSPVLTLAMRAPRYLATVH